jgi:hypothetical protein
MRLNFTCLCLSPNIDLETTYLKLCNSFTLCKTTNTNRLTFLVNVYISTSLKFMAKFRNKISN